MQLRFYLTGYKLVMQSTEKMLENLLNFDIIGKGVIDIAKNVYDMVMSGKSDNNIRFADFRKLIVNLGFVFKGQKGSHMSFYHNEINERMTIQKDGSKAKDYQVKQLRRIIEKYHL